jgi:hypothetical protein
MATSPVPLWAQEMSPHRRGPTGASVLALAVVVVLVVLLLQVGVATENGRIGERVGQSPVSVERGSLCDEHPRWSVCQEPNDGR